MKKIMSILLMLLFTQACKRNNIHEQKQWGAIFAKYGIDSACVELRDHNHEQIYYYNLDRASKRLAPASTFKVFLSLVALEANIALDENLIIPYKGIPNKKEEWNKDMNLREALKTSSEPYYKELARRIGKTELQKWVDSVQYGNMQLGDSVDQCWTNNSLQITADEQVGFIKKFYFDKLPFSQRTNRIVKSMMLQEDTKEYKLYYKTGTNYANAEGNYVVWLIGIYERKETQTTVDTKQLETNYKPYFFAMNFDTKNDSLLKPEIRVNVLREVLQEKGILTQSN